MRPGVAFAVFAMPGLFLAAPATSAPLQPSQPWAVDYGDTQCTAVRAFGSEADPVTLGIAPTLNGQAYRLIVSQDRTGPTYAQQMEGSVDLGRGALKTGVLHYGRKGVKLSIYEFRIPAAQMDPSSTRVDLRSSNGVGYDFGLAEMPAVIDALRKCTADLQQYWHFGQRANASVVNGAKGDLRSIFSGDDYPTEALRKMQGGTAQYQLLVDEKGAVAACELLRESGSPVIDVMGCQVMKERAKFAPAVGKDGKPYRTVFTTPPIVWRVSDGGALEGPTLTGRYVSE